MRKLILIKYASEIFLKGLNKKSFEQKLLTNIKRALKGLDYEFSIDQNRWLLYSENLEEVIERVRKVFGIKELDLVTEVDANLEAISEEALREIREVNPATFKVETKRANKKFPMNSMEASRKVGAYILRNSKDLEVDVHNPGVVINVEIREKAYIYSTSRRIKAVGGMPYKTNGKTMLMLSGGIDSPVAGYMMARRGVELSCVYFHSPPYTSERAKEKVKDLAKILKGYTGNINLYVVPFTNIQMAIINKCPEDELTIIMRRFMMRLACKLAEKNEIQSVTTGESIGQVASQTMEGLVASTEVADRPVFRPLISMDKEDIMDIAKEIGTYETSILPYEDCCTIFVPKHPKTKPKVHFLKKSEEALDVDKLVEEALENTELIRL
ncbi:MULTISPECIES: tRNA uracil 4-sulfurtransferase ThiI [Clostridium]|uniref:Probable tRNA sulfurtransferase n=2 Tax=Clostridium TaxID=1485 RepID=A0A151AP70_9CLOT|nr:MULTISPECIES: tRNA uracil 4-sulfurtransferase ThiI [Clostridium]KYH29426.1 putative tRNA sulfurtransferase [Clostridium colicanis DSM 13634]MBE6044038.1 tRNA 4-thiouridine(8) synthase ThiI [Clostridium thermopalmarium]PRR70792.1 putative tRNA sulfurtransferase [Clostridium thermopalmarium DSM 5974]PVZ28716.1 thiamine biosynthesis protein ThiI [Clostridium thermopalmarium DSM 5974]